MDHSMRHGILSSVNEIFVAGPISMKVAIRYSNYLGTPVEGCINLGIRVKSVVNDTLQLHSKCELLRRVGVRMMIARDAWILETGNC